MTNELTRPAPLTPAGCDLRGNEWFPLHFNRLRKSKWWRRASDTARARNIMMWGEAFQSVPAGSLPNDDDELAEAAGYGMDIDAFLAAKEEILAPWILCADGRWYHPTVCEMALECWDRLSDRRRKEREKKAAQRAKSRPVPPEADFVSDEPENVPKDNVQNGVESPPHDMTGQDTTGQEKTGDSSADADSPASLAVDLALLGDGYGDDDDLQPEDDEDDGESRVVLDDPRSPFDRFWRVYPRKTGKGAARRAFARAAKTCAPEQIVEAASDFAAALGPIPKDRMRFIAHPATWLNQERWDDDLAHVQAAHGEPDLGKRGEDLRQLAVAQNALAEMDGSACGDWE